MFRLAGSLKRPNSRRDGHVPAQKTVFRFSKGGDGAERSLHLVAAETDSIPKIDASAPVSMWS